MEKGKAAAVGAVFYAMAAGGPAQADNVQNGIHGWDEPSKAEFIMRDVPTKFLHPRPYWKKRDVHVDCDLLVKDGDKRLGTIGFVMQFNAESDATVKAMSPQSYRLLQSWKGSMDYRPGKINGVVPHTEGQHGIGMKVIGAAARECAKNHNDHGVDISSLGTYDR